MAIAGITNLASKNGKRLEDVSIARRVDRGQDNADVGREEQKIRQHEGADAETILEITRRHSASEGTAAALQLPGALP